MTSPSDISASDDPKIEEVSLDDLFQNTSDEIEVLAQLFRDQHSEHLRQQGLGLSRHLADRLLIRSANQSQASESLDSLRQHVYVIQEREEGEEREREDTEHSGKWRCSDMACTREFANHDYSQPFPDGKRHIFFWDCCLSDDMDSKKCDIFDSDEQGDDN